MIIMHPEIAEELSLPEKKYPMRLELFERDKKDINRKSSKGNQLKWEKDGVWYKADYTGYEGLSEYVICRMVWRSMYR